MFKRKFAAIAAAATLSVALVPTASAQTEEQASAEVLGEGSVAAIFVPVFLSSNLSSLFLPICSMLNTTDC